MGLATCELREGHDPAEVIVRAMKEFAHPDGVEHKPADINHALQTTLLVASNEYKHIARVTTEMGELPPVRLAGDAVEITSIDNGGGIPEPLLDEIYDPFFTTKVVGAGTKVTLRLPINGWNAHRGDH